ncbi:MAG: WhiB family transcriptional regulator [Micropruina sp.]|nr:WhiB family transcriptional regulator [Micropruina sp.]
MESPPGGRSSADIRAKTLTLETRAATICASCPLLEPCLYRAVIEHDVAGFVAGSTEAQRHEVRRRLGVTVTADDLDMFTGTTRANRQIDRDEVVRQRAANPQGSLEVLAQRLGCSLSTVKRHPRQARLAEPQPTLAVAKPSLESVLVIARAVIEASRPVRRHVA